MYQEVFYQTALCDVTGKGDVVVPDHILIETSSDVADRTQMVEVPCTLRLHTSEYKQFSYRATNAEVRISSCVASASLGKCASIITLLARQ